MLRINLVSLLLIVGFICLVAANANENSQDQQFRDGVVDSANPRESDTTRLLLDEHTDTNDTILKTEIEIEISSELVIDPTPTPPIIEVTDIPPTTVGKSAISQGELEVVGTSNTTVGKSATSQEELVVTDNMTTTVSKSITTSAEIKVTDIPITTVGKSIKTTGTTWKKSIAITTTTSGTPTTIPSTSSTAYTTTRSPSARYPSAVITSFKTADELVKKYRKNHEDSEFVIGFNIAKTGNAKKFLKTILDAMKAIPKPNPATNRIKRSQVNDRMTPTFDQIGATLNSKLNLSYLDKLLRGIAVGTLEAEVKQNYDNARTNIHKEIGNFHSGSNVGRLIIENSESETVEKIGNALKGGLDGALIARKIENQIQSEKKTEDTNSSLIPAIIILCLVIILLIIALIVLYTRSGRTTTEAQKEKTIKENTEIEGNPKTTDGVNVENKSESTQQSNPDGPTAVQKTNEAEVQETQKESIALTPTENQSQSNSKPVEVSTDPANPPPPKLVPPEDRKSEKETSSKKAQEQGI